MRPAQQSYLRHPLTSILASAATVRILRTLFTFHAPLSAPQLVTETRLSRPGVHAILASLVDQQLVEAQGTARSRLYALNPRHPMARVLGQLFAAERARFEDLMADLRDILRNIPGVQAAWLYGSVARGEDGPQSDLDIALVVKDEETTPATARAALASLEERQFIRLSLVDLQDADILRHIQEDAPWWQEVVRDARVLVGQRPEHYAATLKRRESAQ